MKNYAGILNRLHDTPLLMKEVKLRIITEAVTLPLLLGEPDNIQRLESNSLATVSKHPASYQESGRKIAIINVFDSLVSKESSAASGMTSYASVSKAIDSAKQEGATDIGFHIDSPGGEVSVFGLSAKIRGLPDRGINTFAFCEEACSAGYAIAAACQRIYVTSTAEMGSIAVVSVHKEFSTALASEGVTYTVLRSKAKKAPGDPYTPLTDTALAHFTSNLNALDKIFNDDILASRPSLTLQKLMSLAGATSMGQSAITEGLADKVVSDLEAALSEYLLDTPTQFSNNNTEALMAELPELPDTTSTTSTTALSVELSTAKETIVTLTKQNEELRTELRAEVARVTSVLETAKALNVSLEAAVQYTDKKYTAEMAKEFLTVVAAQTDTKANLDTTNLTDASDPDVTSGASTLRSSYKQFAGE